MYLAIQLVIVILDFKSLFFLVLKLIEFQVH